MDVTAVSRRSLSEAVFLQLRDRILSGEIKPGETLPSERVLCAQLEVNRAALREALRRLQQLRLVSVRQGGSTTVLDYWEHGGLELLVAMVSGPGGELRPEVIRSFVEMRAALAPDIAGNAARRRSAEQLAELRASLERLAALDRDAVIERHDEHLHLWSLVVDASGNVAYRMMFNTLRRALEVAGDLVAAALAAETGHDAGYEALIDAIARRRQKAAQKAAADLVGRGTRAVLQILARLEDS